jgi:hypothetical protein
MRTRVNVAVVALVLAAAPLSAQSRKTDGAKIPPGQLPPKGMCRVWITGVPPGQQPAVTTCANAELHRVANSRVIYGDRESFPGRGKTKLTSSTANGEVGRTCSVWDAVVVDGRVVNVCRDDIVVRDRTGRKIRREDLDHEDDDDKVDKTQKGKVKAKALKANKKGKHGDDD